MHSLKYISATIVLLISFSLPGQKWERFTLKFNAHYAHFLYEESLDDALKALAYSQKKLDSADIRYALSFYNVSLAYHGLKELELAKTNIITAHRMMVPSLSDDPNFAEVCELYGRIQTELGYHKSAGELLSTAREIMVRVYGSESYHYLRSLYFKADLEIAMSEWEKVVPTLIEALALHERVFQKDQDYARYANYLGLIYMNNGLYPEAALNFDRALSSFSVPGVEKNFIFGHANNNLALVYYYQSDFEHAALHFERADSIYQILLDGYSENYMMLLNNIASLYYSWDKPDRALVAYHKLEAYLGSNPDGQDLNYIQGVENTGHFYADKGELGISEIYYKKAIKIRRKGSPLDSIGLARILQSLASVYFEGSRPDLAAETALESYDILQHKLPEDDQEILWLLSFLGESYYDSDQKERAMYFYKLAREQIELTDQLEFPDALPVYNNLGLLYYEQENFREAIQCLEKAHQLNPKEPGTLINLGLAYFDMGNPSEARKMFISAKEIYAELYGKNHPDYANALIHEISFKASYGDFNDEMIGEIREVERICIDNRVDTTGRLYIDCLRSYRSYFFGIKEYQKSLEYGKRISTLVEMGYGHNSRFFAETMLEQADSYVKLGDKENLSLLYEEATEIASLLEGNEQESLLYFIETSKVIDYYYLEDYERAMRAADRVIEKDKAQFLLTQNILSSQERANFFGKLNYLGFYNNFLFQFPDNPVVLSNALNNRLFIKGILMESEKAQKEALSQSGDTILFKLHEEYLHAKRKVANLRSEFGVDVQILDSLEAGVWELEKEVSRRLGEEIDMVDRTITWQDIRQSLGKDEAAIEVIRYYHRTGPPTITYHPWYIAFIITRETVDHPQYLTLFDGIEIIEDYNEYRHSMESGKNGELLNPGLYDHIWSKIDSAMEGKKTIYFSPDGLFHKVNVEALTDREGVPILDKYEIKYVNSLKELLQPADRDYSHNHMALLAGDPSFRMSLGSVPDPVPDETNRSVSEYQSRMFPGTFLSDLPGTRTEVDSIQSMLEMSGWECTNLTGTRASEDAISVARNPRLLHLATHGYFAEDDSQGSDTTSDDENRGFYVVDMDSYAKSCLFFSGAQNTLFYAYDYQEGNGDGILTAWEIMEMELDSTELVVLSACESGLGDVYDSEGVYGLRRAFHLAGAKRVMISLWAVDDQATQLLMREFYSNWLSGIDMDTSLANAKRYLMNETRYTHPRYWAAFILSGI